MTPPRPVGYSAKCIVPPLPTSILTWEAGIVTYRRSLRAAGLFLALLLAPSPAPGQSTESASPATTAEELVRVARGHEKDRRWEEALQTWFRVLTIDRGNADAREAIPRAVRNALQAQRLRDPAFLARVLAMSQADVLALFRSRFRFVAVCCTIERRECSPL